MPVPAKSGGSMQRILKFSLALTLLYILATLFFGLRAHSLALISEAGHNVSDFLALALSFVAVYLQTRPATDERTFGYQRAGVLAGFVNALSLLVLAVWIAVTALQRFFHPVTVEPHLMMAVAAAGVVMNGAIAALLWKFSGDVNIRSVFLHMLGDTLSTAAVILGGLAILFTHQQWIDPLLSLIIATMILWSSWGIVRETLHILLEGTPRSLDLGEIRAAMQGVEGVVNVHDLHVWSLTSQSHALSSHVQVIEMQLAESEAVLERINHQLRDHFGIHHSTIQIEVTDCPTVDGCVSPPEPDVIDGHSHHHHGPGGHHHGHEHSHAH
ncbi:cation diffusion facilitator family transporter [Granulicella mallensis]|uniref:Cobalt-zinc-cadmium efflux system protein n=1 Tax=Granulicella mallensis TaxID=940614 RepID=A0A7W7ZSQ8_9BACT|nr:cation diffusion facilitator family transporter [Granulicella mallensis]MBB5065113.1 cobalt-zinc-cadmium efflux system protein [Granulicella mallensis]